MTIQYDKSGDDYFSHLSLEDQGMQPIGKYFRMRNGYMTAARIYAIAQFGPDLAFCIPLIQLIVGLIAAGIHPGIYNKRAIMGDKRVLLPSYEL